MHFGEEPQSQSRALPPSEAGAAFWTGMIAIEIVNLLTRNFPLTTGRGFRRAGIRDWSWRDLVFARRPDCPVCSPSLRGRLAFPTP